MKTKAQKFHSAHYTPTPPKELYENVKWYDKENLDGIFKLFWWCSLHDCFEWFNFEKAFDTVEMVLKEKLGEHFKLPYKDDQKEWVENEDVLVVARTIDNIIRLELDKNKKDKLYENLNQKWKEKNEDGEDLRSTLQMNGHRDWDSFGGIHFILTELNLTDVVVETLTDMRIYDGNAYDELVTAYRKLQKTHVKNKVNFFDELINLCHQSGNLFNRYISVNCVREEFEEEYL